MKIFQLTDLNMNGALTGGNCTKSPIRSEEHTSELQSQSNLVCRLLLETQNSMPSIDRSTSAVSSFGNMSRIRIARTSAATCPKTSLLKRSFAVTCTDFGACALL